MHRAAVPILVAGVVDEFAQSRLGHVLAGIDGDDAGHFERARNVHPTERERPTLDAASESRPWFTGAALRLSRGFYPLRESEILAPPYVL